MVKTEEKEKPETLLSPTVPLMCAESECAVVTAASTGTLYKALTVGTFRNGRIFFMCAHTDAVQNAVILRHHIVLALADCALNARVLTCFHVQYFLSHKCRSFRRTAIITTGSAFMHLRM